MSRFVKVAAGIPWSRLAMPLLNAFPALREALVKKFPNKINFNPANKNFIISKFMEALTDENFQDLAFTLAQQFISDNGVGLAVQPEEMYTDYNQYYDTKATPYKSSLTPEMMPSIAAGGYQTTTGQLPRKEIIPKQTIQDLMNELQAETSRPNFSKLTPAEKRMILSKVIQKYESIVGEFRPYLKQNFPIAGL